MSSLQLLAETAQVTREPAWAHARVAVVIPCRDEAPTIARVVADFRRELPDARIFVFDNASSDGTAEIAAAAGAVVLHEPRRGKGFVVDRILDRVDADYCVMVDGDDTYDAGAVRTMLDRVASGRADMVVGARLEQASAAAFRPLHGFGNRLVTGLIRAMFRTSLTDILSGYRVFNRKVMRALPVVSSGFEVETEMTAHLLYYNLAVDEVQVAYRERPAGSTSKLRTFHDGARVLAKLFALVRSYRPLTFFGAIALVLFLLGLVAGAPPVYGYVASGFTEVRRFPLAILATGLVGLSFASFALGVALHALNWRLKELHNVLTRRPA